MRNLHSWRLRNRVPAPAHPYRRITTGRRGRIGGESRECYAKGRLFSCLVNTIRIGKGDTHIHVEAWWAVPNKIPPINISPQQPPRCIRVCSGPNLRHCISLLQHTRLQPTALSAAWWTRARRHDENGCHDGGSVGHRARPDRGVRLQSRQCSAETVGILSGDRQGIGGGSFIRFGDDPDVDHEMYIDVHVGERQLFSPDARLDAIIDFIAHAAEDAPRLLAEIKRLRKPST